MHHLARPQEMGSHAGVRSLCEVLSPLFATFTGPGVRFFLVGGCVRDLLLRTSPKDWDVEVHGVDPDALRARLSELFPAMVEVGKSFGVLTMRLPSGDVLDVSVPRRESKVGAGHRGFETSFDPHLSIEDACRRRDFTINAMLFDLQSHELLDPFHGAEDLANRLLRVVDARTFVEDPLRVLRAVQFAARFQLLIDRESEGLMQEMVARGDLAELSVERITGELEKLLTRSEVPSHGFLFARRLGVVEALWPEIFALIGTPQEPEWHPEGDVWIHTMMVVDWAATIARREKMGAEDLRRVVFGALCHDLGKPLMTRVEDGRIRSKGHEEAGEGPVRNLCARLSFAQSDVESVVGVTREHLKPVVLWKDREAGRLTPEAYVKALRRLALRLDRFGTTWEVFLAVCEADYRGRALPGVATEPYHAGLTVRDLIAKDTLLTPKTLKPLLSGDEIMSLLNLPPGKVIGEWMTRLADARVEGEISTKEEAVAFIQNTL